MRRSRSLGQRMRKAKGHEVLAGSYLDLTATAGGLPRPPRQRLKNCPLEPDSTGACGSRDTRKSLAHPRTPTSYRDPGPSFLTFTSSQRRRYQYRNRKARSTFRPLNYQQAGAIARRIAPGLRLRWTLETLNPNRSAAWRIWPRCGRLFATPDSRGICDIEGSDPRKRPTAAR